jgi:uncharacterized protein YdiU (UPF0061 family)
MNNTQPSDKLIDLGGVFDSTYSQLPEPLFERVLPTPVSHPSLIALNQPLATRLGLDADRLASSDGVSILAGNALAQGSVPIATAYAGHQFGNWVPQLGDGRAVLIGERVDEAGLRHEIQLKGAGRTSWSRGGDGRCALGPAIREYVLSEAMQALGVPTTRALAVLQTGDKVLRESLLPGAIVVRVARSHVRVGTFQYFTARGDTDTLHSLMAHMIENHFAAVAEAERPALALLDEVVKRQAELVAQWMSVGFIHGVMNTDNCCIVGDTIDYGPAAFMDEFSSHKVFSSIDVQGRYAWGNQPQMAHWNLSNLAQCLLPLIDEDMDVALPLAQNSVDAFATCYKSAWATKLSSKLGLPDASGAELGHRYLGLMEEAGADFTQSFTALTDHSKAQALFTLAQTQLGSDFEQWWADRDAALRMANVTDEDAHACMAANNPVRIPRNHRVEAVIQSAVSGDMTPLHELIAALEHPYTEDERYAEYAQPPQSDERVTHTFCGT